jgi:hypothetical protein
MRHLEPVLDYGEGQLALDQLQRIAAELFESPAFQQRIALALARRKRFQIIAARQQTGCDINLTAADLQK